MVFYIALFLTIDDLYIISQGMSATPFAPVLLIVFNRPDVTVGLVNNLRKYKPPVIYISADGPRSNKPNEAELCAKTRQAFDAIDWPCKIYKQFHENNMGGRLGPVTAINWFFSNEEMGIIIEDDIRPKDGFFEYCTTLLQKHQHDAEIMHINGFSILPKRFASQPNQYFKTIHSHVWGWASWRRAWAMYDVDFKYKNIVLNAPEKVAAINSSDFLQKLYNGTINSWDGQWFVSIYLNGGKSIMPFASLTTNCGFNVPGATNTFNVPLWYYRINPQPLDQQKFANTMLTESPEADLFFHHYFLYPKKLGFLQRVIKKMFRKIGSKIPT
jgi:hypothetical protein